MRDYLKKTEFWSAMILLLLHMVLFPIALSVLLSLYPQLLTDSTTLTLRRWVRK